jgi:YcxB-like protein
MEARYDILPQDLRAFQRYVAKRPDRSTKYRWIYGLLFALIHFSIVPAVLVLFFGPAEIIVPAAWLIIMGQTFCWGIFVSVLQRKVSKVTLREGHDKQLTMTICPDWFRVSHPLAEHAHRWTDLHKIAVTDDYAFFFIEPNGAHLVPRRAFADDQTYFKFLEVARSYFEIANAVGNAPHEPVA